MPERVVLIPFPRKASSEALVSICGGNFAPETEHTLRKFEKSWGDIIEYIRDPRQLRLVSLLTKRGITTDYLESLLAEEGLPDKVSALAKDPDPDLQKIGQRLVKYKLEGYDRAKQQRDKSIVPKWNKIDPRNVVCDDDDTLAGALAKLQSADDTLYIQGHCSAGEKTLQSADYKVEITVEGLIDILTNRLDLKFPGKIKIYACQSALDTVNSRSFAKRFAIELSRLGWVNCTFYGYSEKLSVFGRDAQGHKMTESETRASQSRVFIQVPTQRKCTIL